MNGFTVENGIPYLVVDDMDELSLLFCDRGRDDIPQETISSILSGEFDFDHYWNATNDVYRDVIEELNEKNTLSLYEYIIDTLKEIEVVPETELLSEIASEQNSSFVKITNENIKRIVDDEETMVYLFEDYLQELKSNLQSIYDNSYNSAYESMVHSEVWHELSTYVANKGEWLTKPHKYKKDTTIYYLKLQLNP